MGEKNGGSIPPQEIGIGAKFYDEGFKREWRDNKGEQNRIEISHLYDTSVGNFVRSGDTWYKVVYWDASPNKHGEHYGQGVKVAEGEIDIEQIIRKAGELSGNERETGFNTGVPTSSTDTRGRYIVDIHFMPEGGWDIWEKICKKHNGGESYKRGYTSVAFDTKDEAELAVKEAKEECENMMYGDKVV